ncbi:Predicted ATP-dependent endonuclease of the OLD family, contains P-loop ATPase and TOPRIM domains [Fervidobacterium changbaicum]|uniref:AAA family ATPase n=2 Tax=Fervidobacterium TaxID=2422 RepID=A0AAI8CKD8_FERIS|nr:MULTISPECIES: AAA family ATPase [Fervidobacterium]AMW31992.1 AAA family ATPase [Fervidobacterium islandicum]QAV33775.1 ATP-dependent endonuclease [Fervidobacterium changbaicum]SDH82384.1 Predicted ATP-dependent endonuclease of the OLD family, contains P-loop ATPase and TOPRIM domains [Fervidobacterium changbaicum]
MKIKEVTIHNFRSITDVTLHMKDYSVLMGPNNTGKTNIMSALRVLYGDLAFEKERDLPKLHKSENTNFQESWIEVLYHLTDEEFKSLPKEYQGPNNTLKIRKWFYTEDKDKLGGIYAYKSNGELSETPFYGAKNVGQQKIGKLVYIPDVSTSNETLKLSGRSPFRDLLELVAASTFESSKAYQKAKEALEKLSNDLQSSDIDSELSINALMKNVNEALKPWNLEFGLEILPLSEELIIKNLTKSYIKDENLADTIDINNCGQGVQRYLIFTLIKLAADFRKKQSTKKKSARKEFNPDFTLLLFEEPEVYLHPTQQEFLNGKLRELAKQDNIQVVVTTHSPAFVSPNLLDLEGLCRVNRVNGTTKVYQLNSEDIKALLQENTELINYLKDFANSQECDKSTRDEINKILKDEPPEEEKIEQESIKYFLWIDKERATIFFSNHVVLCEGASEKALFSFLLNNEWSDLKDKGIYFLDCLGKYNINKYVNLLTKLGIPHSVIIDKDSNKNRHRVVNEFISHNLTELTKGIYYFEIDLENFLGIEKPKDSHRKPLNVLYALYSIWKDEEDPEKLKKRTEMLKKLEDIKEFLIKALNS